MITATWCENSALSVGIPRRSTEWSTESSCTRVARNQLDDRGERHRPRIRGARRLAREQQQRGAEQLPLHAHQVLVYLGDDRKVGRNDPPELVGDALELPGHRPLEVSQRDRNDLLAPVTSPWRAPWRAPARPGIGCPRRTPGRTGRALRPACPAPRARGPARD